MPIVRIKYFPEEATSSDVRRFFKKVDIPDGGVHIIGGPKGFVYVRLYDEDDVEIALKRDGKKLSPAESEFAYKVKVSESSEEEMNKTIAAITNSSIEPIESAKGPREVTPPPKNDVFVRLDDLAPSASIEDIVHFFDGIKIALVKQTDSGGAFIKFKSVDDKQDALTYDQKFFGSRFIKVNHLGCDIWENFKTVAVKPVYPSSSKDRETDCDQKAEGDLQEPEIEIDSQCVMISGVAPDVTKKDLVHELLKDCRITKYGLYMETQENKCTGKCYVEFVDQSTRDRAISKANKSEFRGNTVSLEAITAVDMKSRVQQHRKDLKMVEYNRRKEAKAKKKKRKEDIGEREDRVNDELKERERLKEEMLKELEKTSTKHRSPSKSKSPNKTKKYSQSSPSKKIASPSPSATASSKNTTTSSEDEGLSALFAPKGVAAKINSPATIKPAIKIKMNLSATSTSNQPEEESVLKRLQQEQKANEEKSLKKELKKSSKKNEDVDSVNTNTMGLMLMSNIMTNMMTLQNSQKQSAAEPPPPPPPEPEPPALQNEYQQQAFLQLQGQGGQQLLPNNNTGTGAPPAAQNYGPVSNTQVYQQPIRMGGNPRPPKAPRMQNPSSYQNYTSPPIPRNAAPRMPAQNNSHFNSYSANTDDNSTEMPNTHTGQLSSPRKNIPYHSSRGSNRGVATFSRGGVTPRGVRPPALSGNVPPRGGHGQRLGAPNTGPNSHDQNYGAYGSQNYSGGAQPIRGDSYSRGAGNPNRGGLPTRGFANGHISPPRGGPSNRGHSPGRDRGGAYGSQSYESGPRYGSFNKVRSRMPMGNQNGYSGGQAFHDQDFAPRGGRGGPRSVNPHRGGFQQRGRSWMGGPRFR